MSRQRSLSWSSALSDLRADRMGDDARRAAIAAFNAKKLAEARARDAARAALTAAKASPLFVSGSFDRAAVMQLAHAKAKGLRASGDKRSFADIFRLALRTAWADAKAQRRSAAH